MRPAEWPIEFWRDYLALIQVPRDRLAARAQRARVDYRFIDTNNSKRQMDTIAERCELVSGLLLTAEKKGWLRHDRGIAVVGSGPTALIATALALLRGIPVIHVQVRGAEPMEPLAGSIHRWVCPAFYEEVVEDNRRVDEGWKWRLPSAFVRPKIAGPLALMGLFSYGHEPAADIASRWVAVWKAITGATRTPYEPVWIEVKHYARKKFAALHAAVEEGAMVMEMNHEMSWPGLVLNCRFSEAERLGYAEPDGAAVTYTSYPYWESRRTEPWLEDDGPVVISGAGDGGLQDFLRAVWGWRRLTDGTSCYRAIQPHGDWADALREISEKLAHVRDLLRVLYGHTDNYRLKELRKLAVKAEDIEALVKKGKAEACAHVHNYAQELVDELLARFPDAAPPGAARSVYLHARTPYFGPCFLHNLFFALLKLALVRRTGKEPLLVQDSLGLVFTPPSGIDVSSPEICAQYAQQGKLTAVGISNLAHVVLRYGPKQSLMK